MSTAVSPVPRLQFFDNAGAPVALGKLHTYVAGSPATPQKTYSDEGLTVENPNPIILNAAGRPSVSGNEVNVYLIAAAYKFVLADASDTIIWTADHVPPDASGLAASLPSTFVVGDLLVANTTTTLTTLPDVATGSVLASGGIGVAPAYTANPAVTSVMAAYVTAPSLTGAPLHLVEGRLTGTSGLPVTTADVNAATSIYFAPYTGNRITLYDGSTRWNVRTFAEITIALSGFTASKPYDIFAYDNAGSVAIETLVWTNATTRATLLTTQDGVLVKTGATTRRFLGTIYINSSGGQTDDAELKRNISNYYNRVQRKLKRVESTDSWTYTTNTYRQANASTANQVEVTVGWAEVGIDLTVTGATSTDQASGISRAVNIGVDSTTVGSADVLGSFTSVSAMSEQVNVLARYTAMPAVGRKVYAWLEKSTATGTTTWYGDAGASDFDQAGMLGLVWG